MLEWLRRSWGWVVGLALAVVGAGWLWRRERNRALTAEAESVVNDLRARTESATAMRRHLLENADKWSVQIQELDDQIETNQRAILDAHGQKTEGVSREQIRERLRRLGY